MKKIFKIMPVICIMFVSLFFVGCSVEAPSIQVNGGCLISWDRIRNASSYEVSINGDTITTTNTYINIIPYIQKLNNTKEVKVKAKTTNRFLSNSQYSNSLYITAGNTKLNAPQNVTLNSSNSSYLLTWDAVTNADYYCILLINQATQQEYYLYSELNSTSINLYNKISDSGEFKAKVFAYSQSEFEIYAPSDFSEETEFSMNVALRTPQDVNLYYSDGSIFCSWNKVENATGYNISILNGTTFQVSASNSSIQTINLTNRGVNLTEGASIFASVSAFGSEASGYIDSPYSDVASIFSNSSSSSFVNKTLNFAGTDFDLVVDNYQELQTLVWYGLFYRITDMQFFLNYSTTNIGNDYTKAITDYQEIKYIGYSNLNHINSNKYSYSVTFKHTAHPNRTAEDRGTTVSQNTYVQSSNFTKTPRSSDFDDFAINDRTQTALVYTSDQLYYVIQNGCKPVFPDDKCPAKIVYDHAKTILRQICSDDMTDYQKALAIFDWLCLTVRYDYDLVDICDLEGKDPNTIVDTSLKALCKEINLRPELVHSYRGFYIEGVFFDNGQAVCDGIGKTYSLLCGIENIECVKVAGEAGESIGKDGDGNPVYAGHAWNKIKLDLVGNDGIGEWYTLDATWNDFTSNDNSGNKIETLNHSYWLNTDAWMSYNAHYESEISPVLNQSTTAFNYYEYSLYDGINDLNISNSTELANLVSFVKFEELDMIEFAIDYSSISNSQLANSSYLSTVFSKSDKTTKVLVSQQSTISNTPYWICVVYYI